MVNAHQDSDSSSGSSCHIEDELSDPDDEGNYELDTEFYNIEEIINNTRSVFGAPNEET